MPTYYVATLARYVLVEAESEGDACVLARPALAALGPGTAGPVSTVRPATDEEIALRRFHDEQVATGG